MTAVVLFNSIHSDGKGDFQHFWDIANALKEHPALQNFELYAVVNTGYWPTNIFEKKLQILGLKNYFIGEYETPIWENPDLQNILASAVQIIQVSYSHFPNLEKYSNYINPNIVLKYIGEHEVKTPALSSLIIKGVEKKFLLFPMGLSKGTYGIKLNVEATQTSKAAFSVIEANDQAFFQALLTNTGSDNIDHFMRTNLFIPAYFNNIRAVKGLLLLLIMNAKLPSDFSIAIILSGESDTLQYELRDLLISENYKDFRENINIHEADINRIELIREPSSLRSDVYKDPMQLSIYPINPSSARVIRVFTGYFLSDASFYSIFKCASFMAAISGDNTFESTMRNKLLPFYLSTNEGTKKATLLALKDIVTERLLTINASEQTKKDLLSLFNVEQFRKFILITKQEYSPKPLIEAYKNSDLIAMAKVWTEIAQFIIEHYSFYNRLLDIFKEGLDEFLFLSSALPASKDAENISPYPYHQVSQWHLKPPEKDLTDEKEEPLTVDKTDQKRSSLHSKPQ